MENEKILIILVDDNPTNLRIGKNVLSEKYAVATAPSADGAGYSQDLSETSRLIARSVHCLL